MATRKKTKTDKAHDKLKAALKRFDDEQGMLGRRNARKALSAALASVRGAVDEEFPAIRKPPKRTGHLGPGLRTRRLVEKGQACVSRPCWEELTRHGFKPIDDPYVVDTQKTRKVEKAERAQQRKKGMHAPEPRLSRIPDADMRWVPKWASELFKVITLSRLDSVLRARLWKRAMKRGNERQVVEAEVYVHGAENLAGLNMSYRRAAIARLRNDRDFRDAILAVGQLSLADVKSTLESQLSLQELAPFVERKVKAG